MSRVSAGLGRANDGPPWHADECRYSRLVVVQQTYSRLVVVQQTKSWMPAFAGMTGDRSRYVSVFAGMTGDRLRYVSGRNFPRWDPSPRPLPQGEGE
jgi:hypothetical protein